MRNTQSVELLAAYFTLAGDISPFGPTEVSPIPFEARVDAAASAGWKGLGLIHPDVKATADRIGLKEMRRIAEANGLKHLELEFLSHWYLEDERRRRSDVMRHEMMDMAEALGVRDIKIAPGLGLDVKNPTPEEMIANVPLMTDAFGELCLEAAEHGTAIVLEIMPFSNVRTIEAAVAIVGGADQPNGGLLLDIWHLARGGIPYADIGKIPPRFIRAVELDDADAEVRGLLWEDTAYERKLPGEGVLNPPSFIRAVQEAGYVGPWGVEILSKHLRKLPVEEMATRAYNATMAQF